MKILPGLSPSAASCCRYSTDWEGTLIKGAGLNEKKKEPIEKDNPLLSLSNVTLVPHIGSSTLVTHVNMLKSAVQNLIDGLQGKRPKDIVKELR